MTYSQIPAELKRLTQWVCAWNNSKVPMSAYGYEGASSTNPETWATFEQAEYCVETGFYDHIGFVFSEDDGYIGIDIDAGFEDGLLTPLCADIMNHCHSYTEKSKSGRGVHIFLKGDLPFTGKNNMDGVEIYKSRRYFITTGKVLIFKEIIENQDAIDYVLSKYFIEEARTPQISMKSKDMKIYTPEWVKPQEGRFSLVPNYPEINKGNRNLSLLSLAGSLWSTGYGKSEIYKELCRVNQTACKPPLTNGELERIVKSVTKYERR